MSEEEQSRRKVVEAEVQRMKQLPPSSAYATHRLRVLTKILHLLSLTAQVGSSVYFLNSPQVDLSSQWSIKQKPLMIRVGRVSASCGANNSLKNTHAK
ncbi:hypothetical protein GOP47_0003255, partial [Adiantum capillus-veneris]